MNEALEVESGLPISRVGAVRRTWMGLQLRGMLHAAGLSRLPVRFDAVRIRGMLPDRDAYKIGLFADGMPAAGVSVVSWNDAFMRAFGELCETVAYSSTPRKPSDTRAGWAAGRSREIARRSAYIELVERDSFLASLLCPELQSMPLDPQFATSLNASFARLWSADSSLVVVLAGRGPQPAADGSSRCRRGGRCCARVLEGIPGNGHDGDRLSIREHRSGFAGHKTVPCADAYGSRQEVRSRRGVTAYIPRWRQDFARRKGRPIRDDYRCGEAVRPRTAGRLRGTPALMPFSWGEQWEHSRQACEAIARPGFEIALGDASVRVRR